MLSIASDEVLIDISIRSARLLSGKNWIHYTRQGKTVEILYSSVRFPFIYIYVCVV
jgi:hypothetical protein